MTDTAKIGVRIREFGLSRFSNLKAFAEALGIPQSTLSNYMSGAIRPGNKMQARLRELGCDIEWLMTGDKGGGTKKKSETEAFVAFHAPAGLSKEMREAMQKIVDGLSELEPGQIDQARRIIKEAFRKKK
jgi:transcriptional regulator with XRE-family HTH domain